MKNIFSYQYGSVFTGKEIKDFLKSWEEKGKSMRGLRQYLDLEDEAQYVMQQQSGTGCGEKSRVFIRMKEIF